MELWIRTQSRQSLVKVDNIFILERDKDRYIIDSGDWLLGRYKTYERSLEVLDEIQKILRPILNYNPVTKTESNWEDTYERTVLKGYNVQVEHLDGYVYQMPEE